MTIAISFILCLLTVLTSANIYAKGKPTRTIHDEINVKTLNIVDKSGKTRISLRIKPNNEPEIRMNDKYGNADISLTFTEGGSPFISLSHRDGADIILSVAEKSSSIGLFSSNSTDSYFGLNSENGNEHKLEIANNGKRTLLINSKDDKSSVSVFGEMGTLELSTRPNENVPGIRFFDRNDRERFIISYSEKSGLAGLTVLDKSGNLSQDSILISDKNSRNTSDKQ